jgi:hypothetical protein
VYPKEIAVVSTESTHINQINAISHISIVDDGNETPRFLNVVVTLKIPIVPGGKPPPPPGSHGIAISLDPAQH